MDAVGVIGTIAVVASVLVLAYQAHELAKHTEVANQVAGAEAHRELMSMAARVYEAFLAYPELRPFFYDETEATPSEAQRNRLVSVAEMYADSLQTALDTLHTLEVYQQNRNAEDWTAYAEAVLASSSTLRDLVRGFSEGWPSLTPMVARYDAAHSPAVAARD